MSSSSPSSRSSSNLRSRVRTPSRRWGLRLPFGKSSMSLTPKELVLSHQMRLLDDKVSNAHLRAAIEDRARRLAEMKRLHPEPVRHRQRIIKQKYRIERHPLTGADRIPPPAENTKARRWTVRNQLWLWL